MKKILSTPTISEKDVLDVLKNFERADNMPDSLLYFVSELLNLSEDALLEALHDKE